MSSISRLLLQLLDLAVAGALAYERYAAIKGILESIVADGRDPTPEEWATLRAIDKQLDQQLDAVARRSNV